MKILKLTDEHMQTLNNLVQVFHQSNCLKATDAISMHSKVINLMGAIEDDKSETNITDQIPEETA